MHQANQSFHVVLDGMDAFFAKGRVLPDSHPAVKAAPLCFDKLDVEVESEAPAKRGPGRPPKASS